MTEKMRLEGVIDFPTSMDSALSFFLEETFAGEPTSPKAAHCLSHMFLYAQGKIYNDETNPVVGSSGDSTGGVSPPEPKVMTKAEFVECCKLLAPEKVGGKLKSAPVPQAFDWTSFALTIMTLLMEWMKNR